LGLGLVLVLARAVERQQRGGGDRREVTAQGARELVLLLFQVEEVQRAVAAAAEQPPTIDGEARDTCGMVVQLLTALPLERAQLDLEMWVGGWVGAARGGGWVGWGVGACVDGWIVARRGA
jgi:hypothetical protein